MMDHFMNEIFDAGGDYSILEIFLICPKIRLITLICLGKWTQKNI